MKEEKSIKYRFVKQYKTIFGKAVYLLGNTEQLGEWVKQSAIRMNCQNEKIWNVEIQIPIGIQVEYNFFVSPYEAIQKSPFLNWICKQTQKIKIGKQRVKNFQQNNKKQLKIMSFNVRFENNKDKQQYSWTNRKQNCAQIINQLFPDIIGIQQPKSSQRAFLMSRIGNLYSYYGKPRNLIDDEQSGIFIRKDKFKVIEDGYIWINENKVQGQKGFGSRLPRYFTYLVVAPFQKKYEQFLVINTHLDHQSQNAKFYGIKYISETINYLAEKYQNSLKNVFLTGDFNTSQDDQIFKQLQCRKELLKSMRLILPEEKSDLGATFNGFSKLLKYVNKGMKFFNLDPGATIDHIFFRSENYQPISFECIREQSKIISDHFPIIGTFRHK